jgi:ribonuclease BN (tRNA processing enzyme)
MPKPRLSPAKDLCSLKCFGTGDGLPSADRNHAAFLYRLGQAHVLVDCGEAIDRSFKASGLSYDTIDAIFLSHLHADHFGGFFMLLQGFWLEGRKKDLPVYLTGRAVPALRRMLQTAYLFDEALPFRLQLRPLAPDKALPVGQARVTAFRTSHLEGTRARFEKKYRADFRAYCFLLEGCGRRIGHSADLGRPEDLEPLLAEPLDLLVCEMAHFGPEAVFRYLQGRPIKQVAWVHLGRPQRQKQAQIQQLAKKMLPQVKHRFPEDGDEIAL